MLSDRRPRRGPLPTVLFLLLLAASCDRRESTTGATSTLEHLVCDGRSWTRVSLKEDAGIGELSCASRDDSMYLVSTKNKRLQLSVFDGARWHDRQLVPFAPTARILETGLTWVDSVLHLAIVEENGAVTHGSYQNNSWTHFQALEVPTDLLEKAKAVAVAAQGRLMHLCLLDSHGQPFHALHDGMSWLPLRSVSGQQGLTGLTCATVDGTLHLFALDAQGSLWHFVRDGTWTAASHYELPPSRRTKLRACAVKDKLYVVTQTQGGKLEYATWQGGAWTAFEPVPVEGRVSDFSISRLGRAKDEGEVLFLCALSKR